MANLEYLVIELISYLLPITTPVFTDFTPAPSMYVMLRAPAPADSAC